VAERRLRTIAIVAAVCAIVLAALAGLALWRAVAAGREADALEVRVEALEAAGPAEDPSVSAVGRDVRATAGRVDALTEALATLEERVGELDAAIVRVPRGVLECGSRSAGGSGGWTSGPVQGAGDFNVTARNTGCAEARAVVEGVEFAPDPPYRPSYPGWECAFLEQGYEYAQIRCTAGDKAVRWETGS
jgi:hypothetical protein